MSESSLGADSQSASSCSSGSALVETLAHSSPGDTDVVMDSADVVIPLADGRARDSKCVITFVKVSNRYKREAEKMMKNVKTVWRIKSLQLRPLVLKRGRSDSSSSTSSSSGSKSQEEIRR